MPVYTFFCNKCENEFEIVCSIREYSTNQICKKCKSAKNVVRNYIIDANSINTSVKKNDNELKTIGDLANRNRDRMSEDEKTALYQKHNEYKDKPSPKQLPKGMSRLSKQTKTKWT